MLCTYTFVMDILGKALDNVTANFAYISVKSTGKILAKAETNDVLFIEMFTH